MKKAFIIIFALLITLNISACTSNPVGEKAILEDIKADTSFAEAYPEFKTTGVTIEKRQTDKKEKTDLVYAGVHLKNADASVVGNIPVVLHYGLYDKGWTLDSWEWDESKDKKYFTPLSGVVRSNDELAEAMRVSSSYNITDFTVVSDELNGEEGTHVYTITATAVHKYVTYTLDISLTYPFMSEMGIWDTPMMNVNITNEAWDISGQYKREGDSDTYIINDKAPAVGMEIIRKFRYIEYGWGNPVDHGYVETVWHKTDEMYDANNSALKDFWIKADTYHGSDELKYSGFGIKIMGDYSSLYTFEYLLCDDNWDNIIFIGKDDIAVRTSYPEVDQYTRKVIFELDEWTRI